MIYIMMYQIERIKMFDRLRGCNPRSRHGFREFMMRGPFGHGGPFGRGGKMRGFGMFGGMDKMKGKLVSSEEMHLLILLILKSNGKSHGYEIIKSVEELTSGVYAPSPGMIYPLLSYIVELEQAISEPDGNRKSFTITPIGEQYLEDHAKELEAVIERIKMFGERMANMKARFEEEETSEENWGRGESGAQDFEMRATFHDIRHQLRKAIFAKRRASNEEKQRVFGILRRAIDEINNGSEGAV